MSLLYHDRGIGERESLGTRFRELQCCRQLFCNGTRHGTRFNEPWGLLGGSMIGQQLPGAVSFDRILSAPREPQNWLTYSGTLDGHRFSGLTQVTPNNVAHLQLAWVWQAQSLENFEATPLVVDGVMYTVQAPNDAVALDGATGRLIWRSSYTPASEAAACCGRVNRGLAVLGVNAPVCDHSPRIGQ